YDGVDQNCNGSSDYDADFDGYDATSGGGTDCDDTDAVVNPGVVERCNTSVDDNCDGDTNDNGAYQCDAYALDADGDGYGDPALGDCFCTLPTGYSDNTDDCDDADGAVNPSATEVCSDGVDNNCDDSAAGCGVVGLFDLSNADDRLEGVNNSDELGWAIAAGDVDALPGADVLVSAILEDAGGTQAGAVYLLSGGSTDLADPTAAAAKLTGEDTADYAGKAVGLEDFDQDGLSELLVGAPGGGSTGGGVVYLVSPASASGTVSLGMATARWDGEASGDEAGAQLGTGDLTGDGQPDLLIGARKDSSYASESGAVYLIGAPLSSGLSTATAKIQGTTIRDYLGTGVTVGDFNGDGVGDLVVGAPGAGSGGSIWLLEGPLSGTSTVASATARLNGENSGDSVGSKLVTGDCDGDGLDDLVVGAPGVGSLGATYLVRGGFSGTSSLSTAFSKWAGEGPNDASGSAVALGDTNGDGSLDLQMGAVGEDAGGTDAGAVYLVLGPLSSGTLYMNSSNVDAKIEGDFQSSATGSALSFGDLDADGYEELLIGAVERNALDGALYVLAGGGL
ncbi:MAG TPA: putative metal-binding motif-containing protein, partial [Myxococcota bacterium]|nr:putative metal-binding motif-containing protein [Myxococcota bacterium]